MEDRQADPRPTDVETGSTSGRTHAEVLEATLGRKRARDDLAPNGPPEARGSVVREHREEESP